MVVIDKTRIRRASNAGGYEVRRKDWAEITQRFPTFSPEYWHTRTIYIVRSLFKLSPPVVLPLFFYRKIYPSHSVP
jgi:hypothetical protein